MQTTVPPHVELPYKGTTDTVVHMLRLSRGARGELSEPLRVWVEEAIRYVQARDTLSQIGAIYDAFDRRFSYVHDPIQKERVKDPQKLVEEMRQHGVALGDCDDAACFLHAAPRTIGIRTQLARVGFRRPLAGRGPKYSHVLAIAWDQYGRPVVLDPVAGRRTPRMLRGIKQSVLGLGA